MNRFMHAYCERELDGNADGPMRFVASTPGEKRDGLSLEANDWDLTNYLRHPVILWSHSYMGDILPIGTGSPVFEGERLLMDVNFDTADPFAMRVKDKAQKGMIAGSVGWDRRKDGKNELLEFSLVVIPADPDSLPVRQRQALADMSHAMLEALEEPQELQERIVPLESGTMIWRGVAAAMVDLLQVTPEQMTEIERREIYNGLEKLYRRLGKTPPEYMTAAELAALGDDELQGLLLEDEPFAGRQVRFTREALGKLSQAAELIRAVVEGAGESDPPAEFDYTDQVRQIAASLAEIGG